MLWADVTDPYVKSLEDKFLKRQPQVEAVITVFKERGFGVTNYYGDGVVRMGEGNEINDLACFIGPDGTIGPIHSLASLRACAEIHFAREEARKRVAA